MTAKYIVDVVVPVYNAPDDVRRCVESVLAHTGPGYRLVLIDDASPDPGVARVFDGIARAAHPHVELMRNERNLGFTGTANRGMGLSRRDVVLLNSDTIVTDGWLEALLRCAASTVVGTITPWSNNAGSSYPRFCVNNAWPAGADPAPLARAFARAAVPSYPDLPTGVGFCFFVRRAMLDAIGGFDTAFGAGYGEENDLCMRAAAAGWRNVLADDALVLHTGGRSFEKQKDALVPKNTATLLARHPGYLSLVHDYVAADPLAPLRDATTLALDAADSAEVLRAAPPGRQHGDARARAGRGHARTLPPRDRGRGGRPVAHRGASRRRRYRRVRPRAPAGRAWGTTRRPVRDAGHRPRPRAQRLRVSRQPAGGARSTCRSASGATSTPVPDDHVPEAGRNVLRRKTDPATCSACLAAQPSIAGVGIVAWREARRPFVERASFLIAPSRWSADTLARFYPSARMRVVPHGIPEVTPRHAGTRLAVMLPDDGVPTVAVLGAVGPDKGARRIERLVELARERGSSVRFVLIGYLDRQHSAWQSDDARFTVHGRYDPRDLPDLLAHYRVSLVLYPSAGPETFSYTLSEAWSAGRPVLVPPIGALPERVSPTGAGWVLDDAEWRDERRMLDRIEALLASSRADDLARASRAAAAMPRISLRVDGDGDARLLRKRPARSADHAPAARAASSVRVCSATAHQPRRPRSFRPHRRGRTRATGSRRPR
ncbi:MAG: glycosyltransferase, partial [Betaproteobacteria bacterium]|nr:glycosyltransferase [Betaproteobacteria bacterium]